jgi:hypothetical protein
MPLGDLADDQGTGLQQQVIATGIDMAMEPGARTGPAPVGIVAIFASIAAEGPQILGPMRLGLDDDDDAIARLLPGQRPLRRGFSRSVRKMKSMSMWSAMTASIKNARRDGRAS